MKCSSDGENSPVVEHGLVLVGAALRQQHLNPAGLKALSPQGSLHHRLCRGEEVPSFSSAPLGNLLGQKRWKEVQVLWLFVRGCCQYHPLCLLSLPELTPIRIRASSAVQMECCCWVPLTAGATSVLCVRGLCRTLRHFSLMDPCGKCASIFQSCQLV